MAGPRVSVGISGSWGLGITGFSTSTGSRTGSTSGVGTTGFWTVTGSSTAVTSGSGITGVSTVTGMLTASTAGGTISGTSAVMGRSRGVISAVKSGSSKGVVSTGTAIVGISGTSGVGISMSGDLTLSVAAPRSVTLLPSSSTAALLSFAPPNRPEKKSTTLLAPSASQPTTLPRTSPITPRMSPTTLKTGDRALTAGRMTPESNFPAVEIRDIKGGRSAEMKLWTAEIMGCIA